MLRLVIESFMKPREAMREILDMRLDWQTLVQIALLLSCLYGVAEPLIAALAGPESAQPFVSGPIAVAIVRFVMILAFGFGIAVIGRAFGGTGAFHGAPTVSVWYTVVCVLPNVFLVSLQLTGSSIAPVAQLGVVAWLMVIFATFIQTLHGFKSLFVTLIGVVGSAFVVILVIVVVLVSTGLISPEALP